MPNYQTRQVLAGAYRGGRKSYAATLSHTVDADGPTDDAICGKVKPGHMADEYSNPAGLQVPPTCKACLRKDPRFKK